MVRILNGAGYDFAIPGNHEFDYGMDNFLSLAKKLKCGYTSCNFVRLDTGKPVLTPYRIFPFTEGGAYRGHHPGHSGFFHAPVLPGRKGPFHLWIL